MNIYIYMYVDIYNKHIFCPMPGMPGMHDNFALFLMIGIGIVVIDLHFHGFPK